MKLSITRTLKPGKDDDGHIVVIATFGYKEFDLLKDQFQYKPMKYHTGISASKINWDEEEQLPREKGKVQELKIIEETIQKVYDYLILQDAEVTPEILKKEVDKILGKKKSSVIKKVRIVDFINEVILKSESLKKNTKPTYTNLANKLIAFEEQLGYQLYSNDLKEDLYLKFINNVREQVNKVNAVWSIQKVFISTLHEIARRYKITVFDPKADLAKKDIISFTKVDSVTLDMFQIESIINFQPKCATLQNTKLILLTLLFTGCRESDVYKIKPEFEYNKKGEIFLYARYFSEKQDCDVIVPILKPLAEAFEQNNWQPANKIAQQTFNKSVKELAMACRLTEEVHISYTDSFGKKQLLIRKLYKFISSHVGRRSFVTNLINFIPVTILSKISGNTLTEKGVIYDYNKISLIDNAVLFRKQLRKIVEEYPDDFPFALV